MKLTRDGIKDRAAWEQAGIALPGYDVEAVSEKAKEEPGWVHFGIGNIFRVFIGGIADGLLEEGVLDRGITCVETFDYDVVDKIYKPYDNLGLNVILHGDGTREYKVLGALAEAVKAQSSDPAQWNRLKEIFASKSLQMVSFTITEKGYALQKADGTWFPFVEADIQNGPEKATGAMAVLVAMLLTRYQAGKYPIALVSMDNCSQNGAKLRESVLTMAEEWKKAGFVDDDFMAYVSDEKTVAFPWTMIDKITPPKRADRSRSGSAWRRRDAAGHHRKENIHCTVCQCRETAVPCHRGQLPKWKTGPGKRLRRLHGRPQYGKSVRENEGNGMPESGTLRNRPARCRTWL